MKPALEERESRITPTTRSAPIPVEGDAPPQHERHRVRDRIALAFGLTAAQRVVTVDTLVRTARATSATYWLQLMLATGIATLGLVLSSTGVVIGAMLVAPLMAPIVALGMGLAVGSVYLTLQSLLRVVLSVLCVVAASALICRLQPVHEATAEILARTTPNALDLGVAALCAIAAGFTTARSGEDTAATAAGTSIGISLVPPLCVVGFGLSHWSRPIVVGAALLFTANFCAIVFGTVGFFLLLGFDSAPVREVASGAGGATSTMTERLAAGVQGPMGSRWAPLRRLLLPLALIAAVSVPLRRALGEVGWQVRVRTGVNDLLRRVAPVDQQMRTTVAVERHSVVVRMVVVGRAERAHELERVLQRDIRALAGVQPVVSVVAVPDYETLREVADERMTELAPPAAPLPAAPPSFAALRTALQSALDSAWPTDAAGRLLAWRMQSAPEAAPVLEVTHVGSPLGAPGAALLRRALAAELDAPVVLRDDALSPEEQLAPEPATSWLPALRRAVEQLSRVPGLYLCVHEPEVAPAPAVTPPAPPAARGRHTRAETVPTPAADDPATSDAPIRALLAAVRAEPRATIAPGARWGFRLASEPCPQPAPVGTPASASPVAAPAGSAPAP